MYPTFNYLCSRVARWAAFFVLIFGLPAAAAAQCVGTTGLNLYWVGTAANGGGNYNDPAAWRVGSIGSGVEPCQSPRSSDNVYFTASSFAGAGATVTINANANCFNMFWDATIMTAPTLAGTYNKTLEVYGNMVLPNAGSLNFNYRGALIFKGIGANIFYLDARGHNMRVNDFRIDIDPLATLELLSPLVVNNRTGSNTYTPEDPNGGIIYHINGHFDTNGQPIDADGFVSSNSNTARRITFDGSRIDLLMNAGSNGSPIFGINTSLPAANFSAVGSHILLRTSSNSGGTLSMSFHSGIVLDTITLQTARHRTAWGGTLRADYMRVAAGTTVHNTTFDANTLELNNGSQIVLASGVFDNLIAPTGCGNVAIIESYATTTSSIQKKTAGHLVLNNVLLKKINGNTTGGRTYEANNSFDGGGNANIAITAPAACPTELYFRNTISDNWHDEENWYDAGGVQVMQLPSPNTDVFFNNLSGATRVLVNQNIAYCQNMTWLPTVVAGVRLQLTGNSLCVLGDVVFAPQMQQINGTSGHYEVATGLALYGIGKTLRTNAVPINITTSIAASSDYTLLDSMYCGGLFMRTNSILRASNLGISLSHFTMASRDFDNVRVHTRGGGWPLITQATSPIINYTNNCIFYINDVAPLTAQTIGGTFPTMVVDSRGDINLNATIREDLIVRRSANFAFRTGYSTNITVQGNAYFASGIEVLFSSLTSFFRVSGNLTAVGSCIQPNSIRTSTGDPIEFRINGVATIENAFLKGLNSTFPITAVNSIDGTSNTNITFSSGVGTTYYWRAKSSNPANFVGDWSDPEHWTTNPASTIGDNACVPTLADNVVFDVASRSASSNGCTISAQAFCNNLTATSDIIINSPTIAQAWYIGGNVDIANTVQISNYRGYMFLIGAGAFTFNTNGMGLRVRELVFDNPAGSWTLQSNLELDDAFSSTWSGRLFLNAGSLDLNGHDLTLHNGFVSETNKARTLIFTGSDINILMSGAYTTSTNQIRPWSILNAATMNLQAGTINMLDGSNSSSIELRLGDGLNYGIINITDANEIIYFRGNSQVQYGNFNSSAYFYNDMRFDSIGFHGGKTYVIAAGRTQTLNAPNGKMLSFGTSSSFVNLQSSTPSAKAYIYKDHGPGFCIDFLKVQGVIALRQNNIALVPAPYDATHTASLYFDTGNNCDDINGSATSDPNSIWRFSLQPLVTPQYDGTPIQQVCAVTTPASFTIPVVGTGDYVVNYTWVSGAANGSGIINATDSDGNGATAEQITVPINTSNPNITYTFLITTFRCGEETTPIPATITVQQPAANLLTGVLQTATCTFNNAPQWLTMIGSTNNRPMLSIMDYTGAGDNTALGSVQARTDFTATTQTVNIGGTNYPYLRRFWTITPTTNHAAFVRLYFTQTELNTLAAAPTYMGTYTGTLNPATQIQVVRYASGTVGVGAEQIIPHTVTPLTGAAAAPFSSTAGVICVEFYVPSFSAFIIVPTQEALLPLELQAFEAHKYSERQTLISWKVAEAEQTARYEIERSRDGIRGTVIGTVDSRRLAREDSYEFIDAAPHNGYNYYRLRSIDDDGTTHLSDWRTVLFGEESHTIQVLPNPAKEAATLRLGAAARIEVRLYNALGQLAFEQRFDSASDAFELPLAQLPSGVYSLQVLHLDSQSAQTIQLIKE